MNKLNRNCNFNYSKTSFILIVFLVLLNACEIKKEKRSSGKIQTTATTQMVYDALKNVCKDSCQYQFLMGPGIDPHLYKASLRDIEKIENADLVFYCGLHLEGKMTEIFRNISATKKCIEVANGIPKREIIHLGTDIYDPHIWFDVKLWKYCVLEICKNLETYSPTGKIFFRKNTTEYLLKLDSLDIQIKAQIANIPQNQRVIITAHDAFNYFGKAYQIKVRGLQGVSTLSEFGLKDISELVRFIKKNNIKAIFVESSVPERNIEAVIEGCKASGHNLIKGGSLYSDALGDFNTPEGTYIGMMNANIKTIANNLK